MPHFRIDTSAIGALFSNPRILQCPPVPVPLRGVNPRTIKGTEWWDEIRRAAYALNNYNCHACAVYCTDDPIKPILEGHELYEVDYDQYVLKYIKTVALCHSCHSYVHPGYMLYRMKRGWLTKMQVRTVLYTRYGILYKEQLKPQRPTRILQLNLRGHPYKEAVEQAKKEETLVVPDDATQILNWRKWKLELEGAFYDTFGERKRSVSQHSR